MNKQQSPEEILKQPYARILTPEKEGGYSAEILEFLGCIAEGDTPNETYDALERVAKSWIEAAREQGQDIPEPFNNQEFSGKLLLRLPRSIHRQAARMATRDQTSINQFLVSSVAARIGAEELYGRMLEELSKRLTTTINFDIKVANFSWSSLHGSSGLSSSPIRSAATTGEATIANTLQEAIDG